MEKFMVPYDLYMTARKRLNESYPFGEISLLQEFPESDQPPIVSDGAVAKITSANKDDIRLAAGVTFLGANTFSTSGRGNLICIGRGTTLNHSRIQVNGNGCVVIIGENCRLKGLKMIVSQNNSMVFVGSNTTWESGAILSGSGNIVALGNECMASSSIVIRTSDGHGIFDRSTGSLINDSADVMIGHHVWLGNSSRVNKGARIGTGTVLGQCAIASGSLDAAALYAGTPARKLKEGIAWSRTKRYEDIPDRFR
ncbi:hypothetical protein IT41_17910 [Paracoccus halophilus]|uniref:Acyltransferase n=2 Tax=Paracoccus halophilus TaxID=376733 RepID=A0A099EWD9_9RHOB|nr:hypothetical protein IT41_17910 [Paracoccus halophilus]